LPAIVTAQIEGLFLQNRICMFDCTKTKTVLTTLWLSPRPISTGPLHSSLNFHFQPIHLIISQGSYSLKGDGKSHLEGGFALRCFQRLSRPHIATQRCQWLDNWYTRGVSIPVLSY